MKMKTGIAFFLIVSVWIAAAASGTFAQGAEPLRNEAKKVVIDVKAMGERMGVPADEITFPDGRKHTQQRWRKADINNAIAELKSCFSAPENTYLLTEIPEPWITLALLNALKPLNVMYLYPGPGGTELTMWDLERGSRSPNYDVVFEVVEKGDDVFINLNSDTPEASTIGHHTFDLNNLSKVVIPDIPAGKNVFVHGKGMYGVMVCIARNYMDTAKSLSMAAHDSDYICAVSHADERETGDATPRTLQNDL